MKKKTRDNGIGERLLAILSEGPKTTAELIEYRGFPTHVRGVLARLRDAGKVKQDKKGAPWRIHGPAVSKLREEEEPEEIPAAARFPRRRAPRGGGDATWSKATVVIGDPRQRLLARKRELEFARDLALARLEEVEALLSEVT